MEADWEIEIGQDAPVIDAHWSELVDLVASPNRVGEISETSLQPGLTHALIRLNAAASPVWSSKCDVFLPDHIDAGELDAAPDDAANARSCYVDLLWRKKEEISLEEAEQQCRNWCGRLRSIPLGCCRVDLVVRRAVLGPREALGATVYLTACGSTTLNAETRLAECLTAFVEMAAAAGHDQA